MEFVFLFIGLALGFLIGWLLFRNASKNTASPDAQAEARYHTLEKEKLVVQTNLDNLLDKNQQLTQELKEARENAQREIREIREQAQSEIKSSKEKSDSEIRSLQDQLNTLNITIEKSREVFKAQKEKLDEQKLELENIHKKYSLEFENIANKILDDKSKKFTEQNKENLDNILKPLRDKIKDFEERVEKSYKTESDERIALKTEIKNLIELNTRISKEANNLASALKGDNKTQGGWGEMILEKILENSGLENGREYKTQFVTENQDGETIKPDTIVFLPDDKHIIIDSKVSLVAYDSFVNTDDEEQRPKFLKAHLDSLKQHVKLLSDKKYQTAGDLNSPDFVLLFVPIESSFAVAVQTDVELFHYAWDKKIVIVSPSTLLATLRTIASLWKHERQNRNVLEIARVSGSLYDEFVRFVEDLREIEKHIGKSSEAYHNAMKRLSTGRGNLIRTVEKIKSLGAKTSKSLNKSDLLPGDEQPAAESSEENQSTDEQNTAE